MNGEGSGVPNRPHSPCGHRNPSHSRFCDVCGARLPIECPDCHTINRGEANFCSSCGAGLHESQRPHPTPLIDPSSASKPSPPTPESPSVPAPLDTSLPATPGEVSVSGLNPLEAPPRKTANGKTLREPEETLERVQRFLERQQSLEHQRFLERRRRARRTLVGSTVIGIDHAAGD